MSSIQHEKQRTVGFVEPLTIAQGAAAALSIMSSLSSMLGSSSGYKQYFIEISKKLDTLIRGQAQILDEIRDLKVQMRKDIRSEFLTAVEVQLRAQLNHMNVYQNSFHVRSKKDNLVILHKIADRTTDIGFRLSGYGWPSYNSVFSASKTTETLYALASSQVASQEDIDYLNAIRGARILEFKSIYESWLDPAKADSLVSKIAELKALKTKVISEINDQPKAVALSPHIEYTFTRCEYEIRYNRTLVISGSIKDGFTDRIVTKFHSKTKLWCEPTGGERLFEGVKDLGIPTHLDQGGESTFSDNTIIDASALESVETIDEKRTYEAENFAPAMHPITAELSTKAEQVSFIESTLVTLADVEALLIAASSP